MASSAGKNKQPKSNCPTSFDKLSMCHLHTLSQGGNGTTSKYSKMALWVFTPKTDFMNVVHDPIGSRESLSELYIFVTYGTY